MGNPEADPMTESTLHFGQIAVNPTPATSSHQDVISEGGKTARQEKQPHTSLANTSSRFLKECLCAAS